MGNPLKVSLENIIPLTFARDHFSQIVSEVQQDKLFVLTKGGKPAVAIIDVKYLESITGGEVQKEDIKEEIKKAPEKVGLPPMVEHPPSAPKPIVPAPSTKPAGFAAPRPPQPSPITPPMPKPQPPPPIPKPEPKPISPPTPPPPTPKPEPPKPASSPLAMPKEKIAPSSVPNKPLTTLPAVNPNTQKPEPANNVVTDKSLGVGVNNNQGDIDVQFAPDADELSKKAQDGKIPEGEKTAPDDEVPPAQYAGEKPASPASLAESRQPGGGKQKEPEDMALD